jgi:hypothetical protein
MDMQSESTQCDNYTVQSCIHVERVGNIRNVYKSLVGKRKWKKKRLLRPKRKRRDGIKTELQMKQAQWNVLD